MERLHLFRRLRFLVPVESEARLLGKSIYTKGHGWADSARDSGIFFDLSRVEWVDLGSVVQLCLLVESARRAGIEVAVATPLARARVSEEQWTTANPQYANQVAVRVRRRAAAKNFLDYLQFEAALLCEHLGQTAAPIQILSDWDSSEPESEVPPSRSETADREFVEDGDREPLYKYVFPLRWIPPAGKAQIHQFSSFLAGVIGEQARGIHSLDARTLSNAILYELVDNVVQHARTASYALVSAWARGRDVRLVPEDFLPSEQPYINWLRANQTPCVDIVVGDSGIGLPAQLGPSGAYEVRTGSHPPDSDVLLAAFERWSSSTYTGLERGTRGLYRVDRVVKKYQGIITLRASNAFAGLDHGGTAYDAQIRETKQLSTVPGTTLRIRIPPYIDENSTRVEHSKVTDALPPQFEILRIPGITDDGLCEAALLVLRSSLSADRCSVAITEGGLEDQGAIENALRQAAEIRHPGALVLYGLTGDWPKLSKAIERVNEEHDHAERSHEGAAQEHFCVWDPVLILGRSGETAWVGATETDRRVLDALLYKGSLAKQELDALLPTGEAQQATLRRFRNDTQLVRLCDDGSIQLRLTLEAIVDHLAATLSKHVALGREGVLSQAHYRTPTLQLVSQWLDVPVILRRVCGYEFALLALAHLVRHRTLWDRSTTTVLLGDRMNSAGYIRRLGEDLNIGNIEVVHGEGDDPASAITLPRDSTVLIYCDVVFSTEAARRCLRVALRNNARPIGVVCVFDTRKDQEAPITLWGVEVPVLALAHLDISVKPEDLGSRAETNIDPLTRRPEEPPAAPSDPAAYPLEESRFFELVRRNNALHFNHIGRPAARHFTFYLDAGPLINESAIIDSYDQEITTWMGHDRRYVPQSRASRMEIWYPEPEPKPSEPARRIAETLAKLRCDVERIRPIRREAAYGRWLFSGARETPLTCVNVVVIDWGSLTGDTISQLVRLGGLAGAKRLLACICLSQLGADHEGFLLSLREAEFVTAASTLGTGPVQAMLPTFEPHYGPRSSSLSVLIRFLTRFPVVTYSTHECPVCDQIRRLQSAVLPTADLQSFAHWQSTERLKPRTREDIAGAAPIDFDQRTTLPEVSLSLSRFRRLLEDALGSTAVRMRLGTILEDFCSAGRTSDSDADFDVASLLWFFSVEPQWLRRPPFQFADFRERVSRLALSVALDVQRHQADRCNAVVVLRTASKLMFAHNLGALYAAARPDPKMLRQLLYGAFTYVDRPYHSRTELLKPLQEAMTAIQKAAYDDVTILADHMETIDLVAGRARRDFRIAEESAKSPLDAWRALRHWFSVRIHTHSDVQNDMAYLLTAHNSAVVEKALAQDALQSIPAPVIEWLTRLHAHWERPSRHLEHDILPPISRLIPALRCRDAQDFLGKMEAASLTALVSGKVSLAESDISRLLRRLARQGVETLSAAAWDSFRLQLMFFWDCLLSPNSRFSRFVDSAPASPGSILALVYSELKEAGLPVSDIEGLSPVQNSAETVFCPAPLLEHTFRTVLENIRQHWDHVAPARVVITMERVGNRVQLVISNDHSDPDLYDAAQGSEHGTGIRDTKVRLKPFNAELDVNVRPGGGFTCSASLECDYA